MGVYDFYVWGQLKNKACATNPHILEELKASTRHEIDSILEDELIRANAHFLKDSRNVCMKQDNIFNISCYKVRDYFSLLFYSVVGCCAATVLVSICRPGLGLSVVAIVAAVLMATLKQKALYIIFSYINIVIPIYIHTGCF